MCVCACLFAERGFGVVCCLHHDFGWLQGFPYQFIQRILIDYIVYCQPLSARHTVGLVLKLSPCSCLTWMMKLLPKGFTVRGSKQAGNSTLASVLPKMNDKKSLWDASKQMSCCDTESRVWKWKCRREVGELWGLFLTCSVGRVQLMLWFHAAHMTRSQQSGNFHNFPALSLHKLLWHLSFHSVLPLGVVYFMLVTYLQVVALFISFFVHQREY